MQTRKGDILPPQTEAGREIVPYLKAIMMGQALILEQLKYHLPEEKGPARKEDILEHMDNWLGLPRQK